MNFFKIFYQLFSTAFLIFINMRKYSIILKNSKKILRALWEENKQFLSLAVFKKLLKTNFQQFLAINILLTIAKIAKW